MEAGVPLTFGTRKCQKVNENTANTIQQMSLLYSLHCILERNEMTMKCFLVLEIWTDGWINTHVQIAFIVLLFIWQFAK